MFQKLSLWPPLAFARLGGSSTPCDNYSWGPNDNRPGGSGKTTIAPEETLVLKPDGTLSVEKPTAIQFKDHEGFRPLCPFFELYGQWDDGNWYPVTQQVLEDFGIRDEEVIWEVTLANLKPFHHTRQDSDRITASVQESAVDTTRYELQGRSPADAERPLVPAGSYIPLGWMQIPKRTKDYPECRIRITPPRGLVYAPKDFNERMLAILKRKADTRWRDAQGFPFRLPQDQLRLNPKAVWPQWLPQEKSYVTHRSHTDRDFRTMPVQTYAADDSDGDPGVSLGLVDDVSDGFVRCTIRDAEAVSRIVVTPPHFAPDRRPMVSITDGLKDRVQREEVSDPEYVKRPETTDEVRDLLERCLETQGLMNLDVLNVKFLKSNQSVVQGMAVRVAGLENKLFPRLPHLDTRPLPLTELGRQRHRRMLALEILEDRVREDPTLIDRFVRPPVSGDPFFDHKMPALVRGSDGQAMHLTRRQFELLKAWARHLRRNV